LEEVEEEKEMKIAKPKTAPNRRLFTTRISQDHENPYSNPFLANSEDSYQPLPPISQSKDDPEQKYDTVVFSRDRW